MQGKKYWMEDNKLFIETADGNQFCFYDIQISQLKTEYDIGNIKNNEINFEPVGFPVDFGPYERAGELRAKELGIEYKGSAYELEDNLYKRSGEIFDESAFPKEIWNGRTESFACENSAITGALKNIKKQS